MDSCMTCKYYPGRCLIHEETGIIQGCSARKPIDKFDIRRSLNAGRPVREDEPQDDLRAAKGILLGLFIGLVLWAPIWIAIVLIR